MLTTPHSPTLVCAFHTPMISPRLPLPNQLAITLTTLGQPVACSRPAGVHRHTQRWWREGQAGEGAIEREGGLPHRQRIACMAQWRYLIAPSFSKTSTQPVTRLIPQG